MKISAKTAQVILFLGAVVLAACGKPTGSSTADWHTIGSEAKQVALQNHRPLFIAFMGSDWSEPCQAIRKEVLDTQAFKDFADAHLVLVMADFPRGSSVTPEQARQNEAMAKGGQVDRLPVFMLVDPSNSVAFSRIANFSGTPEAFIAQIQAGLDQYQQTLQGSAQTGTANATPPPSSGSAFSQTAPPASAPALPAFPSSMPSPEELMRRDQQAPPSP